VAQFFEFDAPVMDLTTQGRDVHLPSTQLRPIAAADVAALVAEAAQGEPVNGLRQLAGPEIPRLDRLAELTLAARPDGRRVVTDESAGMFAGIPDGVLTGDATVPTARTRYEDWLKRG